MKKKVMMLIIIVAGLLMIFNILAVVYNINPWILVAVAVLGFVIMVGGALFLGNRANGKNKK